MKYFAYLILNFIFFRQDLVGQLTNWHGNLFICAKIDSQNESVNLFEQTCVKFSLKNNARLLHWQDCRGIQ